MAVQQAPRRRIEQAPADVARRHPEAHFHAEGHHRLKGAGFEFGQPRAVFFQHLPVDDSGVRHHFRRRYAVQRLDSLAEIGIAAGAAVDAGIQLVHHSVRQVVVDGAPGPLALPELVLRTDAGGDVADEGNQPAFVRPEIALDGDGKIIPLLPVRHGQRIHGAPMESLCCCFRNRVPNNGGSRFGQHVDHLLSHESLGVQNVEAFGLRGAVIEHAAFAVQQEQEIGHGLQNDREARTRFPQGQGRRTGRGWIRRGIVGGGRAHSRRTAPNPETNQARRPSRRQRSNPGRSIVPSHPMRRITYMLNYEERHRPLSSNFASRTPRPVFYKHVPQRRRAPCGAALYSLPRLPL